MRLIFTLLAVLATATPALSGSNYYMGTDTILPTPSVLSVGGSYTEPVTGSTVVRRTDIATLTPDLPPNAMIVYSRYTPINTTGEYAIIHGTDSTSAWVLRLSDNTVIHKINPGPLVSASNDEIGEVHEIRWDYTGNYPTTIYFVYGMKFFKMDVVNDNDNSILVHDFSSDFPSGVKIINDVEGDSSNDSRYWAWQVLGTYSDGNYPRLAFFTYDKTTDSILGTYDASDNPNYTTELPKPNMVEISPDGDKVLLHYGRATDKPFTFDANSWVNESGSVWSMYDYKSDSSGNSTFAYVKDDGVEVTKVGTYSGSAGDLTSAGQYTINSTENKIYIWLSDSSDPNSSVITGNWGNRPDDVGTVLDAPHVFDLDFTNPVQVSADETHSGWSYDLDGKQLFVSQDNTRDYFQACYTTGEPYPDNCFDFLNHTDIDWIGHHYSKFYDNTKRGWTLIGTYTTKSNWAANQIIMVELKPLSENPRVWRVSPSYNDYQGDYRDEAAVALSFDGNSVFWTSNWNNPSTGHGEVYSVDLPPDWVSTLNGTSSSQTKAQFGTGTSALFGSGTPVLFGE